MSKSGNRYISSTEALDPFTFAGCPDGDFYRERRPFRDTPADAISPPAGVLRASVTVWIWHSWSQTAAVGTPQSGSDAPWTQCFSEGSLSGRPRTWRCLPRCNSLGDTHDPVSLLWRFSPSLYNSQLFSRCLLYQSSFQSVCWNGEIISCFIQSVIYHNLYFGAEIPQSGQWEPLQRARHPHATSAFSHKKTFRRILCISWTSREVGPSPRER